MAEFILDEEKLAQSSTEIDTKKQNAEMRKIILELKNTIEEKGLTALSAPQIGYQYRIFCVKFQNKNKKKKKTTESIHTFINPVATGIRGIVIDREGDPCLPNRQFIIVRNNDISLLYQTPLGKPISQNFSGKATAIIQLMLDHLDGVLLTDLGLEIDDRFDEATEEERNELLEAYMKSLDLYKANLDNYIENDEELKSMKDAVDFIQSVREGKTNLGAPIEIEKK